MDKWRALTWFDLSPEMWQDVILFTNKYPVMRIVIESGEVVKARILVDFSNCDSEEKIGIKVKEFCDTIIAGETRIKALGRVIADCPDLVSTIKESQLHVPALCQWEFVLVSGKVQVEGPD